MTSTRSRVGLALLVAATMTLALAPVMAAAQDGSASHIERPASIFRVDPAFRLDPPANDERWARLGRLSNKATVTLELRDGRTISGTIAKVDGDSLSLFNAGGVLQFTPQEIQRIRQNVRGRMKFIGAAVGLVAGIVVDASRKDSDAPPVSGIMLAAAGFYVAPLIRSEKTLWEHPTRRP
jgi:hypothetical protein